MKQFDNVVMGALDIAHATALEQQHTEVTPYHLLDGLIKSQGSLFSKAFKKDKAKQINQKLKELAKSTSKISMDQLRASSKLSEWITFASSNAIQNNRQEISEQDILKTLPRIVTDLDFDFNKLKEVDNTDENEVPDFLINLNEMARNGKLDPVIGRTKEIRAVMEILGRRGKNNPVLVGPAGVGKTAIVEGLALAIEKNEVPDVLIGKEVYSLDLGSLMAGTKFRGEFEERMKKLLQFVKSSDGQTILFIDEIHQLVGAGRTDGAMDAANLLKPALARGELNCIGATTFDEYQKYILSDSALDRRFRSVPVYEPSKEDAIEILMGLREKLEIHHGIKISDDAVYSAVMLSDQYITDKNLPDKAIDLIDEASSAMKLSAEAMPAELAELESEIRSKMILSQVEKDNDELKIEVEKLKSDFETRKEEWNQEVLAVKKVSDLKKQLDRYKFELEQAERNQDYEEASRLKYSIIPEIQNQVESCQHNWILAREQVAQVIARQTGVPVEKILKSKQDNILEIEKFLNNKVYGQEGPIHEISETLISSYAGLSDETRPLGSFLLLGPSGVGKTETAKSLSEFLFNSPDNIIRLDMSEYSEKHSVAKLIGSPAGYVGYDDGGVLTEAVRRKPHSVILFDEIEKAHGDFSDILLQILDDGRLTDNKGRTINFKNTIILLTSNCKDFEAYFKPEVIGRLDSVLHYNQLSGDVVRKVIDKELGLLNRRLKDQKLCLNLSDEVYGLLESSGLSDQYGARPLKAAFSKIITRPLSRRVLSGDLAPGNLTAVKEDNHILFQ